MYMYITYMYIGKTFFFNVAPCKDRATGDPKAYSSTLI